jgi:putative SOS response-associated peptidase YedK
MAHRCSQQAVFGGVEGSGDWRAAEVVHVIITEPNDFAAEIHDRMPVFLTENQFVPWLSAEAGAEYLKPAPNDSLQRWPVSKRVNSSKADAGDPTLIEPIQLASV